jgi:hypothetical protein
MRGITQYVLVFCLAVLRYGFALDATVSGTVAWASLKGGVARGDYFYGVFPYGIGCFQRLDSINVKLIGWAYGPGTGQKVAISGNYAFLACSTGELEVFDISNPAHIQLNAVYTADDRLQGVAVSGEYIYIAKKTRGFGTVRFIPPNTIEPVSNTIVSGGVFDLAISGNTLAIFRGLEGLTLYDVSSPASPVRLGSYRGGGIVREGRFSEDGAYIYLAADASGLIVIDARVRTNPAPVGQFVQPDLSVYDIDLQGNYAFLGCGSIGLFSVDISNPSSPALADRYFVSATAISDFASANGYGYLVTGEGLILLDISNPARIIFRARENLLGGHKQAYIYGTKLVVCSGYSGLFNIDITDIRSPFILDIFRLSLSFESAVMKDDYIFAAGGTAGLIQINACVPDSLFLVRSFEVSGTNNDVDIDNNWLFCSVDGQGVFRLNVANPATPSASGIFPTPHPKSIKAKNGLLYIADSDSGLKIVSENELRPVGGYPVRLSPTSIDVSYNRVFIADRNRKIFVFDTSNPALPLVVDTIATASIPLSIAVVEPYLLVALGELGVVAYSLSLPDSNFTLINTQGTTTGLATLGRILVITENEGVLICRLAGTHIEEIQSLPYFSLETYPDPFNRAATIKIKTPVDLKNAELSVYNILGRKVKTFQLGLLKQGETSIKLDMCELSSGIYFLRLKNGLYSYHKKITLIK